LAQSHSPVAVQLHSLVALDAHLHSPGWQMHFEDCVSWVVRHPQPLSFDPLVFMVFSFVHGRRSMSSSSMQTQEGAEPYSRVFGGSGRGR
jgi:hypothetical protein